MQLLKYALRPLGCSPGKLCGEGSSAMTSNASCRAEKPPGEAIAEARVPRGG